MTRKEKCLRVIDYYGDPRDNRQFNRFVARHGWAKLFTEEAIEMYAAQVMADHRFSEKLRRENREALLRGAETETGIN